MTAQDLIAAYCEHYGISQAELHRLNEQRHELTNLEFNEFFQLHDLTQENLDEFYRISKYVPLGILNCGISELGNAQNFWMQQQIKSIEAKSILDYGCGIASCIGPLAEQYEVTLADVPGKLFPLLPKLYPKAKLIEIGGESEHYGKYDVVVCREVFEHTLEPFKTAKKLFKLAAPGGLALFSWQFAGSGGNHTHLAKHEPLESNYIFIKGLRSLGWESGNDRNGELSAWRRV